MCFSGVLTFGGNAQVGKDDVKGIGLHPEHITCHFLIVQRFICVDDPGTVIDSELTCKHKLIREQFPVPSTPMMSAQATKNLWQYLIFTNHLQYDLTKYALVGSNQFYTFYSKFKMNLTKFIEERMIAYRLLTSIVSAHYRVKDSGVDSYGQNQSHRRPNRSILTHRTKPAQHSRNKPE